MRSARIFNVTNWKNAVSEVLLVVVGITIALAANSWYENRRELRNELQVLQQMQLALEIDLDEYESRFSLENRIHQDVAALIEHMQSDAVYDPGIIPYFRSVRIWVGVQTNSAPYEALKSSGFDLISSASLQLALIYYYENQFPKLQGAYLNDRAFAVGSVVPYFLENFRQIDPGTFIPDDYQRLREDKYFWNLCMTKISRLQNRILPSYEESIEMIRGILADIEIELDD